jgi:hypothetical protein
LASLQGGAQARRFATSLTIWVDPAMIWDAAPTGKRGRRPDDSGVEDEETVQWTVFPTNAIQTCLTMKVLFGMVGIGAPLVRATMSTRQTTGFVESLLRLIGLDWAVPNFSTLSRRQSDTGPWPHCCRVSPSNLEGQYPLPRFRRSAAPADRQHWDQGRRRKGM